MMQILAFSIRTLQGNTSASLAVSRSEPQPAGLSSESCMSTDYRGTDPEKRWPEYVNKVYVCTVGRLTITLNDIVNYFRTTLTLAGFTLEKRVGRD